MDKLRNSLRSPCLASSSFASEHEKAGKRSLLGPLIGRGDFVLGHFLARVNFFPGLASSLVSLSEPGQNNTKKVSN